MRVAKRYELRAARSSRCEESAPRSRPSALAVLRLMTNSNLVGPKTGRPHTYTGTDRKPGAVLSGSLP